MKKSKLVNVDETQIDDVKFWSECLNEHQKLEQNLKDHWTLERGGGLVLAEFFLRGIYVVAFAVLAVGAKDLETIPWGVAGAAVCALRLIAMFLPLAEVTTRCQRCVEHIRSIEQATALLHNLKCMKEEAQREQLRFMLYWFHHWSGSDQIGVKVPGLGLISMAALAGHVKIIGAVAPASYAFLLKSFDKKSLTDLIQNANAPTTTNPSFW